jgi:hypothetical protein
MSAACAGTASRVATAVLARNAFLNVVFTAMSSPQKPGGS